MTLTQILRFISNGDSSSIAYKTFNENSDDRYPTFTICICKRFDLRPMQNFFKTDLRKQFDISGEEYNQLLKGDVISRPFWGTNISFSDISRFDHDRFNFKLEHILRNFTFRSRESSYDIYHTKFKTDNESWPFYFSYTDPDQICFTRKPDMELKRNRILDTVTIDISFLTRPVADFKFYIHHPGQAIRSISEPDYYANPSFDFDRDQNGIYITLTHVNVLRKRASAKVPCDPGLEDDDFRFKKEVIGRVGCIPIYWNYSLSGDGSFKFCNTSEQMEDILYANYNRKGIMSSYDQPCNYMKAFVGITQHLAGYNRELVITLAYSGEHYQEFVNARDFGVESFWSGVGGFVGIFLGYSLLQLPELFDRFWYWCCTRK